MIVIPPINITDNILESSNVAEPYTGENVWNPATSYSSPTRVYRSQTHKIYESISVNPTVDSKVPELSIYSASPKWVEVRSTNKYSMFDYYNNFKTYNTSTINVLLAPVSRLGSVALLGLENVAEITINIIINGVETEYDHKVNSYLDADGNTQYYSTYINTSIPPYYNTKIRIILEGTGTVGCAICVIGKAEFIGNTQKNITLDVLNFSKTDRDTYGNVSLIKRRSIPKIRVSLFAKNTLLNRLLRIRNKTNAKPVIWCGLDEDINSPYYSALLLLGFYRSFSINIDNPLAVSVNLELEEL